MVQDLAVLVSSLMIMTMDGAALGLKPTLLVRDEKVSLGSTESRNWPLGDSNLKSMVGLCKDVHVVIRLTWRTPKLQILADFRHRRQRHSARSQKGPTEGDGLAWNLGHLKLRVISYVSVSFKQIASRFCLTLRRC